MKLIKLWWPVPVALTIALLIVWVMDSSLLFGIVPSFAFSGVESEVRGNWGTLGDAFGGLLNPLLTFLTIILLIQTIRVSQETLKQTEDALKVSQETLEATKEQLKVNLKELEYTREEIARSADAQAEISKTQAQQRREHTFFELYGLLKTAIDEAVTSGASSRSINYYLSIVVRQETFSDLAVTLNNQIRAQSYLASILRLTVACYEVSDNDERLDSLVTAVLVNHIKCWLCLYAHYGKGRDAELLTEIAKNGRLLGDGILAIQTYPDDKGYLRVAAQELMISHH